MADELNLTESLSRYIVSDQAARLPQPIVERAKIHILDTLGAMISGSTLKPGKVGIDFVRSQAGPRDATIVASELRSSPILAVVLGYDVMCRINKACDRPWMGKRGLPTGSLCSVFGAAAAASRLLAATAQQV